MPNLICGKAAVGGNYNSTHDTIHGSVNVDPVRLLFCGNLTILLLGRIIYCLFKLKIKLRHNLRRPSRNDLVQSEFIHLIQPQFLQW